MITINGSPLQLFYHLHPKTIPHPNESISVRILSPFSSTASQTHQIRRRFGFPALHFLFSFSPEMRDAGAPSPRSNLGVILT
ncbi:hypothetical protein E2542_SST17454 [Spatholobus suberectus]|nr:hypothetical protein E2542_SST17454 [Spatholobus suberectus]